MISWIHSINSIKNNYQQKKNFSAYEVMNTLQMEIINMLKTCGRNSN